MLNEQRQAQRKVLKVKAVVVPEGGSKITARTVDVGSNGVCVAAPDPLKVGSTAELSFEIFFDGKSTPVHTRSKVTYCILSSAEFKIGFQFIHIDLSAMSLLAKFLR